MPCSVAIRLAQGKLQPRNCSIRNCSSCNVGVNCRCRTSIRASTVDLLTLQMIWRLWCLLGIQPAAPVYQPSGTGHHGSKGSKAPMRHLVSTAVLLAMLVSAHRGSGSPEVARISIVPAWTCCAETCSSWMLKLLTWM